MIPLDSEDKIHPNTWWQNEQLQVSLQALPNDGRTHFSVQPFPKYPAGQSKNFKTSLSIKKKAIEIKTSFLHWNWLIEDTVLIVQLLFDS